MNGNAKPGEVGSAADAGDDDVRLLAGHGHLLDRLLADHRLVQQHEVEHRAERVLRPRMGDGVLDRLADGHAERARCGRGSSASTRLPYCVSGLGLGTTFAP